MALVLNDRVKETTTSTGTGTVNLAGAETGFETFVAGIGNTNTTYYAIVHQSADEFEVGLGTVSDSSPDTLSRTTIISSSNSDSAVNFSAGTKDVFCTLPASKAVFIDGSGDLEFNAPGDDFSFKNSSNTIAFIKTDNNDFTIQNNLNDKDFILKGYDADGGGLITGLTIDYSDAGRATFNGSVDIGGGTITRTGDLTLDVSGDITLDAGGENIKLQDDGTEVGQIDLGSSNVTIRSSVQDKDTIFRGNDGGTEIEAMRIDYSEGGRVGIGTSSPSRPFHVEMSGDGALFDRIASAGGVMLFANGGTVKGNVGVQSGGFGLGGGFRDPDLFITTGGLVGIGTTSPSETLTINGNIANTSGDMTIDVAGDIDLDADGGFVNFKDGGTLIGYFENSSNNFVIRSSVSDADMIFTGTDGGSGITALTLDMSEAGAATFNDNVTAYSDERLKDNIETIENGLDKVEQLRGVTYTRDEKENIGVIAQEVEKILPEIVLTADDEMGTKSVDYSRLTAVLIEAVKDLSARVKELEDK